MKSLGDKHGTGGADDASGCLKELTSIAKRDKGSDAEHIAIGRCAVLKAQWRWKDR